MLIVNFSIFTSIVVTSDNASECDDNSDEDVALSTGPLTVFASQHRAPSSPVITSSPTITSSPVVTSSPTITSSPVITNSPVITSYPIVSRVSDSSSVTVVSSVTSHSQETVSRSHNAVSLASANNEESSRSVLQGALHMHVNYSA